MYVVSVLNLVTKVRKGFTFENYPEIRCVGYLLDLNEVIKHVENNILDIHECSYKYAVIEKVSEGFYPHSEEIQWFEWNTDKYKYVKTTKPKSLKNTSSFGIG